MPTISSTTTLNLTAGQALVFLAGSGVGNAVADPGGRDAKYSIGPQQTAVGPFSTTVSVDVTITSGSIDYRVDTDGDLRDQEPAIAVLNAQALQLTAAGLRVGGAAPSAEQAAAVRAGIGADDAENIDFTPTGAGAVVRSMQDKARDVVNVADYGAVGDGVTDDTAAIYAAIAAALSSKSKCVVFGGVRYLVSDTIPLHSKVKYVGIKGLTEIYSVTPNKPVMASASYLSELDYGGPFGALVVSGIRAVSNGVAAGVIGVVVRDYYSLLEDVEAGNCTDGGIKFTHLNNIGASVGGTLVENRVVRPRVYGCGGIGIDLGALDNKKLTDGFLVDALVAGVASTTHKIFCGSSAGWLVSGFHVYGSGTLAPVLFANAFNTDVSGYVESSAGGYGAVFSRMQSNLKASISVKLPDAAAGDKLVLLEKSSGVIAANAIIDLVVEHSSVDVAVTGVYSSGNINAHARVSKVGQYSSKVTEVSGVNAAAISLIRRASNLSVDSDVSESANKGSLKFRGSALALSQSASFNPGNPAVQITKTFTIGYLQSYQSFMGTLHINSRSNYNATRRLSFMGQIYIQAKNNAADNWVVSIDDVVAPVGFSVAPNASMTNNADGTAVLTVTFTPTDTDGYGAVKLLLSPGESV